MSEDWPARTTDPDGREVVFDGGSHLHLFERKRNDLLDQVDVILGAVANPDFREEDPVPGRERFYSQDRPTVGSWLRVVVDFNESPAAVWTAFIQEDDPRLQNT